MPSLMKASSTMQALSVAFSGLAILMSGFALYEIKTATSSADNAARISEQVVSDLARVKPWAFSRDGLIEVLKIIGPGSDLKSVVGARSGDDGTPAVEAGERRYGDPNAQFTLIEYSDFECPACKAFYEIPKSLVDGSKGNISLVFKHVPIHGEASRKAAFAAECAAHQGGNDAFFKMSAQIFEETQSNGNGTRTALKSIAQRIGLDGRELTKCIDQNLYYEKVKGDFKEAVDLGVKVTPTTVIRFNPTGQTVDIGGAVAPEDILKAMSQLVQKSQAK